MARGWARRARDSCLLFALAVALAGCVSAPSTVTVHDGPARSGPASSIPPTVTRTVGAPYNRSAEAPQDRAPAVTTGALVTASGPVVVESLPPWDGTGTWGRVEAHLEGQAGSFGTFVQPAPPAPADGWVMVDVVVTAHMDAGPPGAAGVFVWSGPAAITATAQGNVASGADHLFLDAAPGKPINLHRSAWAYWYNRSSEPVHEFIWMVGGTHPWNLTVTLTVRDSNGPTVGPSGLHAQLGLAYNRTTWRAAGPAVYGQRDHAGLAGLRGWSRVEVTTVPAAASGVEGLAGVDQCHLGWADGDGITYGGAGPITALAVGHLPDGPGSVEIDCSWNGAGRDHLVSLIRMPIGHGDLPDADYRRY